MAKFNIKFLPEAYKDLDSIFDYILLESPDNADNMLDKIMKSIQILEDYPFSNIIIEHKLLIYYNFGALIVKPYIVFYRVIDKNVFIYRVLHGAMDYVDILKIDII